jgi:transposase
MKLPPALPENQADLKALARQLVEAVQEQQQQLAALHQQLRRQDARLMGMPEISTPQAEEVVEKLQDSLRLAEESLRAKQQALEELKQEKQNLESKFLDEKQKREATEKANAQLSWELQLLTEKLFGRKTERFLPNQLEIPGIFPEPPPEAAPESEKPEEDTSKPESQKNDPEPNTKPKTPKNPHKHGRRDLSKEPADRTIHLSCPGNCPLCKGEMKSIGQAVSRRFDWVPGRHEIVEVILDKMVCPNHPTEGVISPNPPFALPKALCGDGLLAKVLVDKFADHIPLHRQVKRFGREGFVISLSTLCDWVLASADLLKPLLKVMKETMLVSTWIQTDSTGMVVLDGDTSRYQRGHLWVYANGTHAVFEYTADGKGKRVEDWLSGYKGIILADGASVFNLVTRTEDLPRAGCWSHARRYIFEARNQDPRLASHALLTIGKLFELEAELKLVTPEARLAGRQQIAKPLLEGLRTYLLARQRELEPGNPMWKAIQYIENQWNRLILFLSHPEIPCHNNGSELQLRQGVVGRKNWMFAGSEGGAEAAAAMYSIVGSCLLQGVDPWVYLRDVLPKLSDWPVNRLLELSPAGFKARKVAEAGLN